MQKSSASKGADAERQAIEDLRENAERMASALTAGVVGIWDWHVADNKVFTNERFAEIYGVDPEAAVRGAPLEDFVAAIHPDDLARVQQKIQDSVAGAGPFSEEYRLIQGDGSVRWVLARGQCFHDPLGRPTHFPGTTTDITERKRNEQATRQLAEEVNSHIKKLLVVIQAIAIRTLRDDQPAASSRDVFLDRIGALARVQDSLKVELGFKAALHDILSAAIAPHPEKRAQLHLEGSAVTIEHFQALCLALALRELVENAVAHGALSTGSGRVDMRWRIDDSGRLQLSWRETGGPRVAAQPNQGFGTALIERLVAGELDAAASARYEEAGLVWLLEMPLSGG